MRNQCANPDADEQRISVETFKDVALAVNLTSVDLVEEGHHDETVEDDGEVLCWSRMMSRVASVVDIEYQITCSEFIEM